MKFRKELYMHHMSAYIGDAQLAKPINCIVA